MKQIGILFLVLSGITLMHLSQAKNRGRKITGQVLSQDDRTPLEGVHIRAKVSEAVTGTQPDGYYYMEISDEDSTLEFEKEGYHRISMKLGSRHEYNVTLLAK